MWRIHTMALSVLVSIALLASAVAVVLAVTSTTTPARVTAATAIEYGL